MSTAAGQGRLQVRPAQPQQREAVDDEDDLGDVLTEEKEGLPHTGGLSPRKRNLPPDQGVSFALRLISLGLQLT